MRAYTSSNCAVPQHNGGCVRDKTSCALTRPHVRAHLPMHTGIRDVGASRVTQTKPHPWTARGGGKGAEDTAEHGVGTARSCFSLILFFVGVESRAEAPPPACSVHIH